MWIYWRLFLIALRLTGRRRRDLVLENLVLRQQLAVWERDRAAPNARLHADIVIPSAPGPIHLAADLRTLRGEASIEIAAGAGGQVRVWWPQKHKLPREEGQG